ncbi:CinA family protein [Marinomonas agarivorans]|nr:CinA family protein [Marinomonas agarivorans]
MNLTQKIAQTAEQIGQKLSETEEMLITAESCTGGLIGATCTEIAGSSQWFYGGIISYDNEAKKRLLQVKEKTLISEGAVSTATVEQMCQGALQHGGDISIAVSGIAGPAGGSIEKPVGTVVIGCMHKNVEPKVATFHFDGDRLQIRQQAVFKALEMVLTLLENRK